MSGTHTGDNIATWLEEVLREYEIPTSKIVAIVTDNGSNIVKACTTLNEKYGWHHVRCAAHTLQLCIKPALEGQEIKSTLGKISFYAIFSLVNSSVTCE